MKKYVKPELFYERFELSQHIADCQWELMGFNTNACPAYPDANNLGAPVLFLDGNSACDYNDPQQYCYQPGTDDSLPKVVIS